MVTLSEVVVADNNIYTPDLAGSGQFGICVKCGLPPTPEGHDGCLGTLPEDIVMNSCCGHGEDSQAYVQFWDGSCVRGEDALEIIEELKEGCLGAQ